MSFKNEEWVELFEQVIAGLRPDQHTKVSVDDKKPAYVRITLVGARDQKTSILVKKHTIIGESKRQVQKVIADSLSAIGINVVRPRDEVTSNRATPNEDGSMSDGEALKLREMLNRPNPTAVVSQSAHVAEGDDSGALPEGGADLLNRLNSEGG